MHDLLCLIFIMPSSGCSKHLGALGSPSRLSHIMKNIKHEGASDTDCKFHGASCLAFAVAVVVVSHGRAEAAEPGCSRRRAGWQEKARQHVGEACGETDAWSLHFFRCRVLRTRPHSRGSSSTPSARRRRRSRHGTGVTSSLLFEEAPPPLHPGGSGCVIVWEEGQPAVLGKTAAWLPRCCCWGSSGDPSLKGAGGGPLRLLLCAPWALRPLAQHRRRGPSRGRGRGRPAHPSPHFTAVQEEDRATAEKEESHGRG